MSIVAVTNTKVGGISKRLSLSGLGERARASSQICATASDSSGFSQTQQGAAVLSRALM